MKIDNVHIITPSTLLYEDVQTDLNNLKLLRPMVRPDDIVWQQMTWENFGKLISDQKFYFRAHSEYDDYDEKKLPEYVYSHLLKYSKGSIDKEKFISELEKIESRLFISCWYNSQDLSDIVFKQYINSGYGVAIGTDVETLIRYLSKSESNSDYKNYKFYAGNIQYVPKKYLDERAIFEETQIIAPIYLKGLQFRMDNEFRLCIYADKGIAPIYNDKKLIGKRKCNMEECKNDLLNSLHDHEIKISETLNKIVEKEEELMKANNFSGDKAYMKFEVKNIWEAIKYIAIKDEGIFSKMSVNEIKKKIFLNSLNIDVKESTKISSSGFRTFVLKQIKEREK